MAEFEGQDKRAAPEVIWQAQEALGAGRSNDPRAVSELFEATLQGDYDDEAAWDAVASLRLRATPEVLDVAMKYCDADDPKARARGLDVLAQLGAGKPDSERPYVDECVSMAIAQLNDESPLVVHSAAWALAHLRDDRAITTLIGMKHHANPDVRHAVAFGMGGCSGSETRQTLIELMEDQADEVRNWATFGLGSLSDVDGPEVREALHKRLDDSFGEARDEAIWGLARRKDTLALQILLERLESGSWVQGDEDAAAEALGLGRAASAEELQDGLRKLLRP
jgi:HEAT repeat protein